MEEQQPKNSGPSRVLLTVEQKANLSKEDLLHQWSQQDLYINWIEAQLSSLSHATAAQPETKELDDKIHHSNPPDATRRENFLLMRLNAKEQEIQDLLIQIQELKSSQASNPVALRSSLLDPSVNMLIQCLRKELEKAKSALEETQNELSAWKFTPDSNTGKRLMAKCRLLYQENEELGRMISSGRVAKLEGDLALQRNFGEEMKKSQSELDEFLLELDEDVEGMQSTIYFLQQQLRQTRDHLNAVQKENEILRSKGNRTQTNDALDDDDGANAAGGNAVHDKSHQTNSKFDASAKERERANVSTVRLAPRSSVDDADPEDSTRFNHFAVQRDTAFSSRTLMTKAMRDPVEESPGDGEHVDKQVTLHPVTASGDEFAERHHPQTGAALDFSKESHRLPPSDPTTAPDGDSKGSPAVCHARTDDSGSRENGNGCPQPADRLSEGGDRSLDVDQINPRESDDQTGVAHISEVDGENRQPSARKRPHADVFISRHPTVPESVGDEGDSMEN